MKFVEGIRRRLSKQEQEISKWSAEETLEKLNSLEDQSVNLLLILPYVDIKIHGHRGPRTKEPMDDPENIFPAVTAITDPMDTDTEESHAKVGGIYSDYFEGQRLDGAVKILFLGDPEGFSLYDVKLYPDGNQTPDWPIQRFIDLFPWIDFECPVSTSGDTKKEPNKQEVLFINTTREKGNLYKIYIPILHPDPDWDQPKSDPQIIIGNETQKLVERLLAASVDTGPHFNEDKP